MAAGLTTAPADLLTSNHSAPVFTPGTVFVDQHNGDEFMYVQVQNGNTVTPALGKVVYWMNRAFGTATTDTSNGTASSTKIPAGVLLLAVTANYFTWIKRRGQVTTSAIGTTGQPQITDGSGVVGNHGAGGSETEPEVGVAGGATFIHARFP